MWGIQENNQTLLENTEEGEASWGFLGDSGVKDLPAVQEMQVRSLAREDPLEEEMATPSPSSILAWESPWKEEPSRLQSWAAAVLGSQRGGHDPATKQQQLSLRRRSRERGGLCWVRSR